MMRLKNSLAGFCGVILMTIISCNPRNLEFREYVDLNGRWQFALDSAKIGEEQQWYTHDLDDSVQLPGTTDSNKKGFLNTDTTAMHLNRFYTYEGAAWYRRRVVIPPNFENKHIILHLERTKCAKVWIDRNLIGSSRILQTPQRFDVSDYLSPGEHHITIRIDNDLTLTPYGNVHIYTDETQTNWNGIIGSLCLETSAKTYISNLQVYPDMDQRKIEVELELENQLNLNEVDIELVIQKITGDQSVRLPTQRTRTKCSGHIELEYLLGDQCSYWDEYNRPLYRLTAVISEEKVRDSKTVQFGMREFSAQGKQFTINGHVTFLRGKNDAAVFPLTGYTPMNPEEWVRVFSIARSYGINHIRFHSYCPPEAAFIAADQVGMYLQVELPFWGGLDSDTLAVMLRQEGFGMLKAYANHPSFVMFSHGNEIWGGHDRVEENINAFKAYDSRPLYTMGSNNNIGYVAPRACSDYYVGARTPFAHDTVLTHLRLTQSFADSREGGILNTYIPSTEVNFDFPVSQIGVPVISHEIGQYQIYPDYREIHKYTGVLRAWNLELFMDRLDASGMGDMDTLFRKASGAWSALCYKAEMEAALRTRDMAGFQLLDLQDYPGQGTALVGILDAFMDSKGVISAEKWKQSCNDVTVLLEFPGYCWTSGDIFDARVVIANYSDKDLYGDIHWEISQQGGEPVDHGIFSGVHLKQGGLSTAGEIKSDLGSVQNAQKLVVSCSVPGTGYSNSYDIWVYPQDNPVQDPGEIVVTKVLDDQIFDKLNKGAKVLLFPRTEDIRDHSFPGLFPPDFWNFGMFKMISEMNGKPVSPGTLGLLMDPEHQLFDDFPTDFHTNWQWFSIIRASNSLILDKTPVHYRPIVQVIDNPERNHKLGMIFEFKTGNGKLLVCMSQLDQIMDHPEANQLYRSILNYMFSGAFDPDYQVSRSFLIDLFYGSSPG